MTAMRWRRAGASRGSSLFDDVGHFGDLTWGNFDDMTWGKFCLYENWKIFLKHKLIKNIKFFLKVKQKEALQTLITMTIGIRTAAHLTVIQLHTRIKD